MCPPLIVINVMLISRFVTRTLLHARIAEAEAVAIADVSRAFAFGSTAIYH